MEATMRRLLAPPDDRRATHYQATTERRTTARRDHNTPDATNADNRSPTPLELVLSMVTTTEGILVSSARPALWGARAAACDR